MKLLQKCRIITLTAIRSLSSVTTGCTQSKPDTTSQLPPPGPEPPKVVYVSTSTNIFENLALEDWLYENADLTGTDYLLMWRNRPAIVIGRHQNPWMECDVSAATALGVDIARRNSGGGTVYHDEGNLNLSFLKSRPRYDRRRNLSEVVSALTSRWDLDLALNCRDDLVLDGMFKVSGTASKLGGKRTYHHFTLLFDVDKDVLASLLRTPLFGARFWCKATKSIPSHVKNLSEDAPDMTFEELVKVIGDHFVLNDPHKQIVTVDPNDESQFPGVGSIQRRLRSFDWVYGKTPPFSMTRTFSKTLRNKDVKHELWIDLTVEKGKISLAGMNCRNSWHNKKDYYPIEFRLLDLLPVVGEMVEARNLEELWDRGRRKLTEEEQEELDYELLVWGMECLRGCVPVGYGETLS